MTLENTNRRKGANKAEQLDLVCLCRCKLELASHVVR
jgi:hypothetical protein